ncbi:MAG TPA: hypothetical protein RMH99_18790 [Sandaracinaceae bacterium LLY-WYZ-13_1]|nr:hypothetical protein [Sandaracinaceae bacterium LLY-WYZ-13_1]
MAQFEVKVRNLKTGETLIASMEDCEQCIAWLSERPQNLEILGVLSDTSPAEQRRLKEAMRPYDAEELELKRKYDAEQQAAMNEAYQKELEKLENDQSASEPDPNADPDRPLSVKYEVDEGLTVVDDDRELTPAAEKAVRAWIEERNGWIADKGQLVGEAHLEVWPNEVPSGDESSRVLAGGRFFPRLRAED